MLRPLIAALGLLMGGVAPAAAEPVVDGSVQASVRVGDDVTFHVSVTGPADEVAVQDALPASLVFGAAAPSQGSCLPDPPVSCALGALAEGVTGSVAITASVIAAGQIDNEVTVTVTQGGATTPVVVPLGTSALGVDCEVVGTQGPDDLVPPDAAGAVLCGLGGDDTLRSGPGRDRALGGAGFDTLDLSASTRGVRVNLAAGTSRRHGFDRLRGIEGVTGSPRRDLIRGGLRSEVLSGEGGSDTLIGGRGEDLLLGGTGPDSLVGGRGADELRGGDGRDACFEGSRYGASRKESCEVRAFATSKGVTLFAPSRDPVGFGFHEALYWTAVNMRPRGRLIANHNPRLRRVPSRTDGHRYHVMASRGRAQGPTTAIDIAMPRKVLSPVNGVVEWVHRYRLYCTQWDWAVAIRPLERPDLRVLVLHMVQPTVRRGQRVTASVTRLGWLAENDPAHAQQNIYFPDRYPHAHIEVERRSSANPPCAA